MVDDDGFEDEREFNRKMLKCLVSTLRFVDAVVLPVKCFGETEHDDVPSTDDDGDVFA